ncbi:MAG: LysR substrate-binding domain-containing protein [Chloroflexota bacterium]
MNLEQLQTFCAVAEQGGFSRAAAARYLAQSTVSMQIAGLEKELGVRLFERLGWRVVLTDAGRDLLGRTTRILSEVEDARRAMAEHRGLVAGRLQIGASHTVGNYVVPNLFGQYNALYPGVRLVLEIATTPRVAERVAEGSLDLGLVEAPVEGSDLVTRPFQTDELVLLVPKTHPWVGLGAIDPAELATERFITREPDSVSRRIVRERLRALGVELQPTLEMGTPEAVREAVSAGLGVGIVSRHVASLALAAGVVAEVAVRGLRAERYLRAVLHSQKQVGLALAEFLLLLGAPVGADGKWTG